MEEIIFYSSLKIYKNELEKLEQISDKTDENVRKILHPLEIKCKNNNYNWYQKRLLGLDRNNIYENEKNKLCNLISEISKNEQKKQNLFKNVIRVDNNDLNLQGFDEKDIEKIKKYIIKKVKQKNGYIYSINCNYTRINTNTLINILSLINSKTLKCLTLHHHCKLNHNILFEKLIEKKFNLNLLDLDTTSFYLSEENLKYLSNLVKNNILNSNSLRIGSSMGLINYNDIYCINKLSKLKQICEDRLDNYRILPNIYRYNTAFKSKNNEEIRTKCEKYLQKF